MKSKLNRIKCDSNLQEELRRIELLNPKREFNNNPNPKGYCRYTKADESHLKETFLKRKSLYDRKIITKDKNHQDRIEQHKAETEVIIGID